MHLSFKWLAEFIEHGLTPEELAERLVRAGTAVESIERLDAGLAGVVVAEVRASDPHPDADKLSVCRVFDGARELQVVCGAKNYKVGDRVPLAPAGTTLPGGPRIERARLRGVESNGMLCSAQDLGLDDDAGGLLILDPGAVPGRPLAEALGLDDVRIELELTPQRPDMLSHLGVAREVAALTGRPLRFAARAPAETGAGTTDRARVRIAPAAAPLCRRYMARVVENVRIGPSPAWMQNRLRACGVRAISNAVDITNYVLLELGHPLHAFDLDRLNGAEIVVRNAAAGEKMTTLDGKERGLDPEDLVIADRDQAVALAGVMGGATSEVSAATTRILIESAWFLPRSVRRTARRHGLHSESSHRFERGADLRMVPVAVDRCAQLMAELCGAEVRRGAIDVMPQPLPPRMVELRYAKVGALLGDEVPREESRRILVALGLRALGGPRPAAAAPDSPRGAAGVPVSGDGREAFEIPSYRVDLECEEDLIEEVARVRGYDTVPLALPALTSAPPADDPTRRAAARAREGLLAGGFDEAHNYAFVSPDELRGLQAERPTVRLKNPIAVEHSVMRTTLLAGLLRNLEHNLHHGAEEVRLFELGRVFFAGGPAGGGQPAREPLRLALAATGRRAPRHWSAPAEAQLGVGAYDLKGVVERILSELGLGGAAWSHADAPHLHPRSAFAVALDGAVLGALGELHPAVAEAWGLPHGVFVAELDFERLAERASFERKFAPLPQQPPVLRDLAFVVDETVTHGRIAEEVKGVDAEGWVESLKLFDVYRGAPVPEGRKSLAYSIRYRGAGRTLTAEEADRLHARIVARLADRLGAVLRA